ncbi:MAG TPA: YndJ family protein [Pyrinomonadaceae bacterium]|nr:YndJ family protein [Pyrinomonadaceae bacterium]
MPPLFGPGATALGSVILALTLSNMLSTFVKRSAAGGVIVWLITLLLTTSDSEQAELVHKVVFWAVLVIVPLGLSVIAEERALYKLIVYAQPIAALFTIAAFFVQKGLLSAALASAWLILNVLIALLGLIRLTSRGFHRIEELSIDAGLLYLPIAGAWLVVYRLGIQPFAFGEMIVLLTAVHFHFAGFATPIIAGMIGRVLAHQDYPRNVFGLSVFALVAAMPLVATGITFSPWIGFAGALLLTLGLMLLAVLTLGWVRPSINSSLWRALLSIGAISSCAAMVLACLYAYSVATHTLIITIPGMAMTHGLLNAFGFVTCSLLVWSQRVVDFPQ